MILWAGNNNSWNDTPEMIRLRSILRMILGTILRFTHPFLHRFVCLISHLLCLFLMGKMFYFHYYALFSQYCTEGSSVIAGGLETVLASQWMLHNLLWTVLFVAVYCKIRSEGNIHSRVCI